MKIQQIGPQLVPWDPAADSAKQLKTTNSLEIALLGIFGGPGDAARLAGQSEEKVAATNQVGAAAMGVVLSIAGPPGRQSISRAPEPSSVSPTGEILKNTINLNEAEAIARETSTLVTRPVAEVAVGDGLRIVGKINNPNISNYNKIISSIKGKIIFKADALTPGALGDDYKDVPGTFSGGRYTTIQLDKPLKVFRAWSQGQSREFGAFWSLDMPTGGLQSRIDSALLPEWGTIRGTALRSQATQYTVVELPKGTIIHVGEVGTQGGVWVGGKSQLLIEGGVQPAWKFGGGKLQ